MLWEPNTSRVATSLNRKFIEPKNPVRLIFAKILKGILLDIDNHSGDSPSFKKIFSNPSNSLVSLPKEITCSLYSLGQSP